jgi:hypothetical protein
MTDFAYDEVWTHYHRDSLRERYGVGTFVAVIDCVVIDWAHSEQKYANAPNASWVSQCTWGAFQATPRWSTMARRQKRGTKRIKSHAKAGSPWRRFHMWAGYEKMDELRILGARAEYYGRGFMDNGAERPFADHDYRLMLEHEVVPKSTTLVAGIVF